MSRQRKSRSRPTNQVRIIAGEWRGRKLEFPDAPGLRPTPDRVRETVFNWLQMVLPGAVCLDLFAGSGVMGFEALSRGAAGCTLVERDAQACAAVAQNRERLQAGDRLSCVQTNALTYLAGVAPASLDLVFLDPPYGQGLVAACLAVLEQHNCLKAGGLLYLEQESTLPAPPSDACWQVLKQKQAGQVSYYLLRYQPVQ